jgi:hypothetical protein
MKIALSSIKKLCSQAELPGELVERHIDALTFLVLRTAEWQRKRDANKIRAWWFNNSPTKPQLFEVLLEEDEGDVLE